MKKLTLLLFICFLTISLISILTPQKTYAASSSQIQVDKIDHVVMPLYGGLVLINDTIQISSTTESATVENFSIGFPFQYRNNLCFSAAYEVDNFNAELDIVLNTGIGALGYYGVTVVFQDDGLNLAANQSYTFTITFIFSDLIESATAIINATTEYVFTADFPLYPSVAQDTVCNVTFISPENAIYQPGDLPFNFSQNDERFYLTLSDFLPKFSKESATIRFVSESKDSFACLSVNRLTREIALDTNEFVSVSELYLLENRMVFPVDSIKLHLPEDARNVTAFDELGGKLRIAMTENETFSISLNLAENQARSVKLGYNLYGEGHLVAQNPQIYKLTLDLSKHLRVVPNTFILKIIFPEGAAIQSFPEDAFNIQRDVLEETLSLSRSKLSWLQNEQWSFTYSYPIFWESLRPTLWTTALVIIGSIIALAWQRPEAPMPVSVVLVPRKTLNDFVETYEEKKKRLSQLEQIKRQAQKGKLSRRRYKVRKTTLENRLALLSKRLTDLKQEIMNGGAKYADNMRQLEVAETELDNISAEIQRIEVRFKRGEISAQTYRRLLEGALRRRERAKTTIDGVLLRLRE